MYKDWRGYESLALEVITAVENNLDPKPLLHRFICYLEVLYGHVKMRAVLADEFPYSGRDDQSSKRELAIVPQTVRRLGNINCY